MKSIDKLEQEMNSRGYSCLSILNNAPGKNNSLFKIKGKNGLDFALKSYSKKGRKTEESILRQYRESTFLELAEQQSIESVPKLVEVNKSSLWTIFSWIDGGPITSLSTAEINATANFLNKINANYDKYNILEHIPAKGSYKNHNSIIKDIEQRIERLKEQLMRPSLHNQIINKWFEKFFLPFYKDSLLIYTSQQNKICWKENELRKYLVPADLGVHNMIRSNGKIYFVDFEYAGKDDIAKASCDFVLQPNNQLTQAQERIFLKSLKDNNEQLDKSWLERYNDIKRLTLARWTLIMLNSSEEAIPKDQFANAVEYFQRARSQISQIK